MYKITSCTLECSAYNVPILQICNVKSVIYHVPRQFHFQLVLIRQSKTIVKRFSITSVQHGEI